MNSCMMSFDDRYQSGSNYGSSINVANNVGFPNSNPLYISHTIPPVDSSNYLAIFCEYSSEGQPEKQKILSLDTTFAYCGATPSKFNSSNTEKNLFIGCRLKSKYDGVGNRTVPIDCLFLLDISGSMGFSLGGDAMTCMDMSKKIIRDIITTNLLPCDRAGLAIFDTEAEMKFGLSSPDMLKNTLEGYLTPVHPRGGTNIGAGLDLAIKMITSNRINDNRICRLFLITDMCDNESNELFLSNMKTISDLDIFISIIGIGTGFNVQLTEKAKDTKGFNYMTVTTLQRENQIISKFNHFFFPIAYNINLTFESSDIILNKVYGTNFDNKMFQLCQPEWKTSTHALNDSVVKRNVLFIFLYFQRMKRRLPMPVVAQCIKYWVKQEYFVKNVCEISTCTATDVIKDENSDKAILKEKFFMMKCSLKSDLVNFALGRMKLSYCSIFGEKYEQFYPIYIHGFRKQTLVERNMVPGVSLFYYGKLIRKMLRMYHNKDGSKDAAQRSKKFLSGENLALKISEIKKIFQLLNVTTEFQHLIRKLETIMMDILDNMESFQQYNFAYGRSDSAVGDDIIMSEEDSAPEEPLKCNDRYIINIFGDSLNQSNRFDYLTTFTEKLKGMLEYQRLKYPPSSTYSIDSMNLKDENEFSIYIGFGANLYIYWRYYLYCKSQIPEKSEEALAFLNEAFTSCQKFVNKKKGVGLESFYFGLGGIYSLSCIYAIIINNQNIFDQNYNNLTSMYQSALNGPGEVLYGTAGYLYCLLLVKKECGSYITNMDSHDRLIACLVAHLHKTGVNYKKKFKSSMLLWPFDKFKNVLFLGAAHGNIGVIHMMLNAILIVPQMSEILGEVTYNEILLDLSDSLHRLLSLQYPSSNLPPVLDKKTPDTLLHFCHGSPGAIPLFLNAYKLFQQKEFISYCIKAGEDIWKRGLLLKGDSLCHGISGHAYVFHSIFRVTRDDKWLNRCIIFCNACIDDGVMSVCREYKDPSRQKKGVADRPYSLMEGRGGTINLFCDMLNGEEHMRFPGYEI